MDFFSTKRKTGPQARCSGWIFYAHHSCVNFITHAQPFLAAGSVDALPFPWAEFWFMDSLCHCCAFALSLSLFRPIFLSPLIASWEKSCFALVMLKAPHTRARVCLFWYVVSPPPQNFKEQIDLACAAKDGRQSFVLALWISPACGVILGFASRSWYWCIYTKVLTDWAEGFCAKSFSVWSIVQTHLGGEVRAGLFSVKVLLRLDDSKREREEQAF